MGIDANVVARTEAIDSDFSLLWMGIATIAGHEVWRGKRSPVHRCQIDSVFISRDSDVGIRFAVSPFRITGAEHFVPRERQEAAGLRAQVTLTDNQIKWRSLSKPIAENTRSVATGYIQPDIPKVDGYCFSTHNDRDSAVPKALPPRFQNIVVRYADSNLKLARFIRRHIRGRSGTQPKQTNGRARDRRPVWIYNCAPNLLTTGDDLG